MSVFTIGPPDPLGLAWFDTSDLGNARRLSALARGKLLWIEEAEAWAHFDGRRWALDGGNREARRWAHRVIEHVDEEAEALADLADDKGKLAERFGAKVTEEIVQDRIKTLRGHAVRSGSAGMTAGMLKQAQALLAASEEDFDRDPLAYNTLSHTLRFKQRDDGRWYVEARPHDPGDMIMQLAEVEYDPAATSPFWRERLEMLTPDAEQLAALPILYGYTLTGLTSEQAFYVHQGKGGDGKSVTHQALAELHGDYYRHAGVRTFLQGADRGGAEHRSDLVRLRGDIRFVTCDEPKARSIWDGETIKQVTGSLVTARGSGERTEVTYRPRFKLFVECNKIPSAPSDDRGFRRRFKLFMWKVVLAETKGGEMAIDLVLAKLTAERSGILNWMIEGALIWLETRQVPQPSAMRAVLSEFWASSSPMGEWMDEWCDTSDPGARENPTTLHNHFKDWCEQRGIENILSVTKFGRELTDKQIVGWKDPQGSRWRLGIQLRREGLFNAGGAPPGAAAPPAASFPPPGGDEVPYPPYDDEDRP